MKLRARRHAGRIVVEHKDRLATSSGQFFGDGFKPIRDKICRRKRGSKRYKQSLTERDNYLNQMLKSIPWTSLRAVGFEALKDMKKGKNPKRNKAFRKAMAPWTYRRVLARAEQLAEENRVLFVSYPPAYTSQTCPKCGTVSKTNRRGESFNCVSCGHASDADTVGAVNGLVKTRQLLGSLESPRHSRQ